MEEHKFNFAYIYFESKAGYIAMMANAKVPIGSGQWVRLMKERIRKFATFHHSSAVISPNSKQLYTAENNFHF